MLSDLDGLMKASGFGALICWGESTASNPELAYLTRAQIPRGGLYIKKLGVEPLLVVSDLDVGVARLGVVGDVRSFDELGYCEMLAKIGRVRALAQLVAKLLKSGGDPGRVAVCGYASSAPMIHLVDSLRRMGFRVSGQARPTFLDLARACKDRWELEAIQGCGIKTLKVVERFEKLLIEADIRGGKLILDGQALTVGALKRKVYVWCAELGLTLPEGVILSNGPDSAEPHHPGSEGKAIEVGQPIVFDIFPRDASGYMYDFTRTYFPGRPTSLLKLMLEDVRQAHQIALDNLREGVSCEMSFIRVCLFLRKRGWPTPIEARRELGKSPGRGFVHSLGHGVGLTIGEEPYLRQGERSRLKAGMVVTVEPGLYEPGLGGVRIEDVVAIEAKGVRRLAEHPYTIEL